MTYPKRWADDGAPPDIERLLRAARAEHPEPASLARSLSAVGAGLGATSAAVGAKAAGATAGLAGTAKAAVPITGTLLAQWAALVGTVATVAFGAAKVATDVSARAQAPAVAAKTSAPPRSVRVPPASPSEARVAPVDMTPSRREDPAPAPISEPPRELRPASPASSLPREAAPDAGSASSGAVDADTLAEQVESIDHARAALANGDAAQTLLMLNDYERRFPTRGFGPEALFLRMEAYTSLGRASAARATAQRLLASYPSSLHGARARALLSKEP